MVLGGFCGSWSCVPFLHTDDAPLKRPPALGDWLLLGFAGLCLAIALTGMLLAIYAVATGSLRRRADGPLP